MKRLPLPAAQMTTLAQAPTCAVLRGGINPGPRSAKTTGWVDEGVKAAS